MLVSYFLYKGLTEEVAGGDQETFYLLCHMIEEVVPKDYYTNMVSLSADINVLILFLSEKMPAVFEHLRKLHFELPMVLVELFITVFTNNRSEVTDVIMDAVLIDGPRVYYKVILVFLDYFAEEILNMHEFRNPRSPRRSPLLHQGKAEAELHAALRLEARDLRHLR